MMFLKIVLLVILSIYSAAALPEENYMLVLGPDGQPDVVNVSSANAEVESADERLLTVDFLLYTRNNQLISQTIVPGVVSSLGDFNRNNPTKIISHGWVSSPLTLRDIRTAYLSRGGYNVIMVDWSTLAAGVYNVAKANTRRVGEYIAELVDFLVRQGTSLDNIHIIGHSLGAQISGVAGNRVSGTVGRVTGLDPALPLFITESLANRLDPSDGRHVEVIHTCGGTLGWSSAIGDIDFYPNGGEPIQPGCGLDTGGICSHMRAVDFFAESITTNVGFWARQCSSWLAYRTGLCRSNPRALMGEFVDTSATGTYYLETGRSSPFAQG